MVVGELTYVEEVLAVGLVDLRCCGVRIGGREETWVGWSYKSVAVMEEIFGGWFNHAQVAMGATTSKGVVGNCVAVDFAAEYRHGVSCVGRWWSAD